MDTYKRRDKPHYSTFTRYTEKIIFNQTQFWLVVYHYKSSRQVSKSIHQSITIIYPEKSRDRMFDRQTKKTEISILVPPFSLRFYLKSGFMY